MLGIVLIVLMMGGKDGGGDNGISSNFYSLDPEYPKEVLKT